MADATFEILFLIARPAAGKSEIIDYLKRTPESERRQLFHVGPFVEIDDFPMIWTWFEEDALLDRLGKPRLHTDPAGYFLFPELWHVLIGRLGLDYHRLLRDDPLFHERGGTVIVEFARGKEHGGFRAAFEQLPPDMLQRAGILYVNVSWEESLRKNRARFNPERPDSILEHSLQDAKLERLYRQTDWPELSAAGPQFIVAQDIRVPYVVFENEDDVTTSRGQALGGRLADALGRLWALYEGRTR